MLIAMKRMLISLLAALVSVSSLLAAERTSEVTVIVGETINIHPAGMLFEGIASIDGEEFVKVKQVGKMLEIEGEKEGLATLKLSLLYGKSMTYSVRVVTRSFSTRSEEEPEGPEWTGHYELHIPQDNFCISYSYFNPGYVETSETIVARIAETVVNATIYYDSENNSYDKFDYDSGLGYNGAFVDEKTFMYLLGDGAPLDDPNGIIDGEFWFDEYAPHPASDALLVEAPLLFGWDNQGNDDIETGIVMQRMRQYGRQQSYLKRFYRGEEEVMGVKCWVFDMRGQGVYGVGDLCWWIDPETGLALKYMDESGAGMMVKTYDLDYREWDAFARPELFD